MQNILQCEIDKWPFLSSIKNVYATVLLSIDGRTLTHQLNSEGFPCF